MRTPDPTPVRAARPRRAGPQSVGRIFRILDTIAGTRVGATLSELARITVSPKTSLVGLLAGLTAEGCLLRDGAGRYFLGPRIHSLAMRAMAGRELVARARPVLAALVEATGETAVLGGLTENADLAIYLDKVDSPNSIRYAVAVGERRDLYCTAMGKALLAHFEPARVKQYLRSTTREKFTSTTITGASALLAELARVRRDGIAQTSGERVNGASGLAAPVFAADGKVVAAVLIAGPSGRMRANAKNNERALRRAAAECTQLAGGTPRQFRPTGSGIASTTPRRARLSLKESR